MTSPSEMKAGDRTLSRAAGMVAAAKGDFDRLSRSLSDTIVGYHGTWQGRGGRAFFDLHQAWTERQDRIVQALGDFESALTTTERDNVATDQAQSDNLARNQSRLSGVAQY